MFENLCNNSQARKNKTLNDHEREIKSHKIDKRKI